MWNKLQTCTPFTNWSSSNWCSWFNQSVPRGLLAQIKLHSQHLRFVSGHPESNSHYSTRFPPSQTGKISVGEVFKHFSDYTACAVFKKQVLQALGSSCLAGRQQGMNSWITEGAFLFTLLTHLKNKREFTFIIVIVDPSFLPLPFLWCCNYPHCCHINWRNSSLPVLLLGIIFTPLYKVPFAHNLCLHPRGSTGGKVSGVQHRVAWIRALDSLGTKVTQKSNSVISAQVHSTTDPIAGSLAGQQAAFCSPIYSWEYVGVF